MARTKNTVGGKAAKKRYSLDVARARAEKARAEQKEVGRRHRFRPGTRALQEIRRFQRTTDLLLRRLPFQRLVREICQDYFVKPGETLRWTATALEALQEAAEAHLTHVMEDAGPSDTRYGRCELVCYPCQTRYHHAKRHSAGAADSRPWFFNLTSEFAPPPCHRLSTPPPPTSPPPYPLYCTRLSPLRAVPVQIGI
eukprot:g4008.t1